MFYLEVHECLHDLYNVTLFPCDIHLSVLPAFLQLLDIDSDCYFVSLD